VAVSLFPALKRTFPDLDIPAPTWKLMFPAAEVESPVPIETNPLVPAAPAPVLKSIDPLPRFPVSVSIFMLPLDDKSLDPVKK
jgi:hypothetical protein